MNNHKRLRMGIALVLLVLGSIACTNSSGNGDVDDSNPVTAELAEISGKVQVLKSSEEGFKDAVVGQQIFASEQVLTYEDSRARIELSNGTMFRLGPHSTFTLTEIGANEDGDFATLNLEIGQLWIILKGGKVDVDTPSGLASVRGSYLYVEVVPGTNETIITCLEGDCSLKNGTGIIKLVAGQSASVTNYDSAPTPGLMSDEDVQDWLDNNPEATQVIIPLTATVEAQEGNPLPKLMTSTATVPYTATSPPGNTPTPSATAFNCGPPSNWVPYTVQSGDTLDLLSQWFQTTIGDLQYANCMGDSTVILAGDNIYIPNVEKSTATFTPTFTPKPPTSTPLPTTIPPPANALASFANPIGPDGTTITNLANCSIPFSIDVTDADGIADVKVYYAVNDPTMASATFQRLSLAGGSTYSGNLTLDTWVNPGTDTVHYVYTVIDNLGVAQDFPASGTYSYTDAIDCGNVPSSFLVQSMPLDGSTISVCSNYYQVNVTDPESVANVYFLYSADPAFATYQWELMTNIGSGNWDITYAVDTSKNIGTDVVYWKFKAYDSVGDITIYPVTPFSYSDSLDCDTSTMFTSETGPAGAVITDPNFCSNTYTVNVSDLDSVQMVELAYSLDGGATFNYFVMNPLSVDGSGNGTYDYSTSIDATSVAGPTRTITYKFKARDGTGSWNWSSSIFTFDDMTSVGCGP